MSLVIAIPSKGRLKEKTLELFASAGLCIEEPEDSRSYQATITGLDGVEIAFLSASEIARELASGTVHLGVTGEDLARETIRDADNVVDLLLPLGFGHADVVVAVPDCWIIVGISNAGGFRHKIDLEREIHGQFLVWQPVPGSSAGMSVVTMAMQVVFHGCCLRPNRHWGKRS